MKLKIKNMDITIFITTLKWQVLKIQVGILRNKEQKKNYTLIIRLRTNSIKKVINR